MLPKWYSFLPASFQTFVLSTKGYLISRTRFNETFESYLAEHESKQPTELDKERFRAFLNHAEKSPFWKKRFADYNLDLAAIDILQEIKKLPILSKNEVKRNINLIKINYNKSTKISTSGTTGSGLVFEQTQEMENRQWAVWWRYRKRLGINRTTWMGWFGGKLVIPVTNKKPPYYRINYPGRQVMFSAHHLNIHTVDNYVECLNKRKITWLHGYPSQISYLASLILERDLSINYVTHITTGAENLMQHQIILIEKAFGVRPFQHYGLAEGVSNISQLSDQTWQIDQDFAYTEFVKESPNGIYSIIGTNYSNLAFPLIRYDTKDTVLLDHKTNNILEIRGRKEDSIIRKDGTSLGRLDHIFKSFVQIKEAQIYQYDDYSIVLRIVPLSGFDKTSEMKLMKTAKSYIGKEENISLKLVDSIDRTASGKLKFVISELYETNHPIL